MISKFKAFCGPVQFVFKDPDTGMLYGPEKSKKLLIDRITAYRKQNGLEELQFIGDVLENYWCSLPENIGRCQPKMLKLGILPTLRGGVAVLKNYLYDKVVKQDVAEKRALQCVSCPYNRKPETEGVKRWLDLIALNSVKTHRTSQYDKLGTCSVCSCPLNMKVFYAGTIDRPGIEEQRKYDEVDCWQKGIIK